MTTALLSISKSFIDNFTLFHTLFEFPSDYIMCKKINLKYLPEKMLDMGNCCIYELYI